jgi:hypothetical protein
LTGLLILAAYFAPWCVAVWRGHRNKYAILALNLFTGWTGLGWIAALVWSLTDNLAALDAVRCTPVERM